MVDAAGRDAYAQARHALDEDAVAKKELGFVIRGLRAVIKKRLKAEAELRDIVDALDAKGLLDSRCVRGLFRAMRAGDVEPGSLKWRDADEMAAAAAGRLSPHRPRAAADTLVSAGDLITWWRTGGRSTGLSTTALKTPDTVRALAKDVLARRAEAAARAAARRDFRGERPPLRDVGFDEEQLKAHDLRHLSAAAVDRRARADDEGEARCVAAAAALVRKGQEKKKRTTKVAPERMNGPRRDVERRGGGRARRAGGAQQPQDGAVSQREAEKILAEAEQRLEDECREMLTTPHGRDALVFEAARLRAAAWLEDGGTEDQKLAASAARCFDAGSDGIVDGRAARTPRSTRRAT